MFLLLILNISGVYCRGVLDNFNGVHSNESKLNNILSIRISLKIIFKYIY